MGGARNEAEAERYVFAVMIIMIPICYPAVAWERNRAAPPPTLQNAYLRSGGSRVARTTAYDNAAS